VIAEQPRPKINRQQMVVAGIPEHYWGARLSDVPDDYEGAAVVRRYADTIVQNMLRGVGLRLLGPGGHGKTHAAVALLKRALAHGAVGCFTEAQWITRVMFDRDRTTQPDDFGQPVDLRARLENAEFLVIDDMGVEHDSRFNQRAVESLLRLRLPRNRSTLITTNLLVEPFAKQYGDALCSFMAEKILPVVFMGRDWRVEKAKRLSDQLGGD
jgi:DNA replication protein DnaC